MKSSWVAGGVRSIALSKRTIGRAGIRAIAGSGSWDEALARLAASPYSRAIRPGQSLAAAQRAVAAALLWNLRVLAGWLPPAGVSMLRIVAGWFEVANIEARLQNTDGETAPPPFDLGALATYWRRLAATATRRDMQELLATTPWRIPADSSHRDVGLMLRAALLDRAVSGLAGADAWTAGAAALLVAADLVEGHDLPDGARRAIARIIGEEAARARTLPTLQQQLPRHARWVFDDVETPERLWLAEAGWWTRIERDGYSLLGHAGFGPQTVLGACAVMAADAWRVRGALEIAARSGRGRREFDALA